MGTEALDEAETNPLLKEGVPTRYGGASSSTVNKNDDSDGFRLLKDHRTWSFQEARRATAAGNLSSPSLSTTTATTTHDKKHRHHHHRSKQQPDDDVEDPRRKRRDRNASSSSSLSSTGGTKKDDPGFYLYCLIYAIVNVIISAPGLYGYAAVIFNHPVFADHMNALSKLVIFSSLIHQLGFFLCSSLDFAIGTVQDAGLIFLSSMANTIANRMQDDGHSEAEIVSTTLVLLSLGTAVLGIVLILLGYFRLADAVAYLPMPVVGGYLAFIGYFCCQAGVALCISKPMLVLSDWGYLLDHRNLWLALPGLATGVILTLTSRLIHHSGALPLIMVAIPALFYLTLYLTDTSMDTVRAEGWVGEVAPSVPVGDLFHLVDLSQVRWDLISHILPTWVGMTFVVAFASCLDVAAISIDMGEALETNRELATVGICNLMSGLTFGFTGSYIFSQTIFTYRTGVHSRIVGVLIMLVFFYIVVSPVNVLQISPLFFLGSTLIFIGYDLMFEWLWEVRHQVFFSEYGTIWLTFCAIHVVGIDAGIIVGVLVAIVEQIVTTAQTSDINRIDKRSRAVWTPKDGKLLHDHVYTSSAPKIMTLEIVGTVFFGSALSILNQIIDEIGLGVDDKVIGSPSLTPRTSSIVLTEHRRPHKSPNAKKRAPKIPPKYLVLDLMRMTNLDASAARGCFLQLVKMCAKRGIVVCASGASPRIEWMLRSHQASINDVSEEEEQKGAHRSGMEEDNMAPLEKILLFVTVQETLEFCESSLIRRIRTPSGARSLSVRELIGPTDQPLDALLALVLGASAEEGKILERLNTGQYHDELLFQSGDTVFDKGGFADAFFIVVRGCVASTTSSKSILSRQKQSVISGAGVVQMDRVENASTLLDPTYHSHKDTRTEKDHVGTIWQTGGIFGYIDFMLERPRYYRAAASLADTKVAKFTRSDLNLLQNQDSDLYHLLQKVLLHASTVDLSNCTCHDV